MNKSLVHPTVQQKVAEALRYRGYFVTVKEDGIYLSSANHREDLLSFISSFKEVGLTCTDEGKLGLLPELDIEKAVEAIRFMPGRNHESGGTPYWGTWKYFIKRKHGPKIRTITLDPGIALLTKAISAVGISTIMCCDGHGRRAPHVMFDGAHNGIWFDLIQKQWMEEIELYYSWEVGTGQSERYMVLQAQKGKEQRWDIGRIQEDAYRMSQFLLNRAEELSDLKRHILGKGMKPTKRLMAEMTLEEKQKWMGAKWEEYFSQKQLG